MAGGHQRPHAQSPRGCDGRRARDKSPKLFMHCAGDLNESGEGLRTLGGPGGTYGCGAGGWGTFVFVPVMLRFAPERIEGWAKEATRRPLMASALDCICAHPAIPAGRPLVLLIDCAACLSVSIFLFLSLACLCLPIARCKPFTMGVHTPFGAPGPAEQLAATYIGELGHLARDKTHQLVHLHRGQAVGRCPLPDHHA